MVFGTFGKMSSNVKDFVVLVVDYGAEHFGKSMTATTLNTFRQVLKLRYIAQLSIAYWRRYAKLTLHRIKYVGYGIEGLNRDWIRLGMIDMADNGEFDSLFLAHKIDMPHGVAFQGGKD
jgi:hypothetical protein